MYARVPAGAGRGWSGRSAVEVASSVAVGTAGMVPAPEPHPASATARIGAIRRPYGFMASCSSKSMGCRGKRSSPVAEAEVRTAEPAAVHEVVDLYRVARPIGVDDQVVGMIEGVVRDAWRREGDL